MSSSGDTPWRRPRPRALLIAAVVVVGLVVALVVARAITAPDDQERLPIRIAAVAGAEQQVLGALVNVALEAQGIPAELLTEPGDVLDARAAVRSGLADLYVDYTGSAWTRALGRSQPLAGPRDSFDAVQAADEANGLEWVAPTQANATLALFVRPGDVPDDAAATITWLAGRLAGEPSGLCADQEFLRRRSGLEVLAETYAISTDLLITQPLGEAEALQAVAAGTCFSGLGTASSGIAAGLGLVQVTDDQQIFPAFLVAPVIGEGSRADAPDVRQALADVMPTVTTGALAELNAAVDAGAAVMDVARAHVAGSGDG